MSLIVRVAYIAFAAAALLVGIQGPNFVDQYEKRLDAHLIEVRTNLAPFQEIADRFHRGSLEALIAKHEHSQDPTFHAEGSAIRKLYERYLRFRDEQARLQTDLLHRGAWIAVSGDRELVDETWRSYSFALVLDSTAVIAGASFMMLIVMMVEILGALRKLFRVGQPGKVNQ